MTLQQLLQQQNFGTDKNSVHSYIDHFYDREFAPYQSQPITLIEIGVNYGESLRLWAEYFTNAHIIGIEKTPLIQTHYGPIINLSTCLSTYSNVQLVYENAYTMNVVHQLPQCDIFIDDGSHDIMDQMWAAQHFSLKVKPGGLFIIEDVSIPEYLDVLTTATPAHLRPYIEHADLRDIKNRYDDILFVIRVPHEKGK